MHKRSRVPDGRYVMVLSRSGSRRGSGRGLRNRWRAPAVGSLRPRNPPLAEKRNYPRYRAKSPAFKISEDLGHHAVPHSVRRRWMAHRPSLKARHSAQPPRISLLCLHAIVLAHDLRERSAKQFERYQRARVVSRKAFKGRWRWLDTVGGGSFLVLPTGVATCRSPQSTRWQTRKA